MKKTCRSDLIEHGEAGIRGSKDNLLVFKECEQWQRRWFCKNIGYSGNN